MNIFIRLFDLFAPVYDLLMGARTPLVAGMRRRIVERLMLREGDSVLEIAVGSGGNLPYIHEAVGRKGSITGVDLAEGMLRLCRRNMDGWGIRAKLLKAGAEDLPFGDGAFDAVLNLGSIKYIEDRRKAVSEALRVVKRGSCIVFAELGILSGPDYVLSSLPNEAEVLSVSTEWFLLPVWVVVLRKSGR